ncbi:hypothetical protein [Vibrio tasmaniensis]|uniref:hypothetical protein n=1 Tax=Vibrio tasmaniensis TaxID=212663 RepID=UPI0010812472|nr:hypothetical protein [Vibrio tasmaniensis]
MEILDSILLWLNTNWRAIATTISLCFTVYFARQRIGDKLTVTYQVRMSRYSDEQITKLVISNRKDKTVSIWSIYAVIENDIKFEVHKPDVPIILKAGESVSIAPEKYSYLTLNGDRFEPKLMFGKMDFYINLGNRVVKCIDEQAKNDVLNSLPTAAQATISLDDHIYNEVVRFILIYYFEGEKNYAYFEDNGFIGHEWNKSPNHMGRDDYTANDIKNMLERNGYDKMFSNFICFEHFPDSKDLKVVFRKENS